MSQRMSINVRFMLPAVIVVLLTFFCIAGLGCKSDAAQEETVQDFVGMSETDAKAFLEEAGISVEIVYQPGPDDMIGMVIEQDPASGQWTEEATAIVLTVGSKEKAEVPSLLGLTQEEAAAKLAAKGLKANLVSQDTNDEAQAGLVLAQDPPAGTSLDKESQVSITVGNYVPDAAVTENSGNQGSSYVTCPECGGSGRISKVINIPKQVPCSNCGGSGFIDTGAGPAPCPVCGGRGSTTEEVYNRTDEVTCPTCGGSGRVPR
jgi:hypothetical protein